MRVERKWFLRQRQELFEKQCSEAKNHLGHDEAPIAVAPGGAITCDFTGEEIETTYIDVYVSPQGKEYALCKAKSEELQREGYKVEMHDSLMTDADPASQIVS